MTDCSGGCKPNVLPERSRPMRQSSHPGADLGANSGENLV